MRRNLKWINAIKENHSDGKYVMEIGIILWGKGEI